MSDVLSAHSLQLTFREDWLPGSQTPAKGRKPILLMVAMVAA